MNSTSLFPGWISSVSCWCFFSGGLGDLCLSSLAVSYLLSRFLLYNLFLHDRRVEGVLLLLWVERRSLYSSLSFCPSLCLLPLQVEYEPGGRVQETVRLWLTAGEEAEGKSSLSLNVRNFCLDLKSDKPNKDFILRMMKLTKTLPSVRFSRQQVRLSWPTPELHLRQDPEAGYGHCCCCSHNQQRLHRCDWQEPTSWSPQPGLQPRDQPHQIGHG